MFERVFGGIMRRAFRMWSGEPGNWPVDDLGVFISDDSGNFILAE